MTTGDALPLLCTARGAPSRSKLLARRGKARPARHHRPRELKANGPNRVWSWDITYLRSPVRGMFYYLYLVVDVWSRKIVGWAVRADYFRPFSCKVFHPLVGLLHRLCPSCSQKRTLLFGEYVNERLLLRLPHRQMVFTFPKVLRVFFLHDRNLFGEVSRFVYRMIQRFSNEAAGRSIQSAAVIAYASAGDFVRFNPHLHGIFLEGGFDRQGRFVHIPSLDLARLARYFRTATVAFFLQHSLISERLTRSMLAWTHSGFSVDLSVRIPRPAAGRSPAGGPAASSRTREALAQYIARPPISLSKMLVEEPSAGSSPQGCGRHEASVLYRSEYNPYFKTNVKLFPALEFLVQLLQHLPEPRAHLVRRYGLYSSLGRQPVAKQTAGGPIPGVMDAQAAPRSPRTPGMDTAA
jgi:hypothetical protein